MKHKKILSVISLLIIQILLLNAILTSCGLFGSLSAKRYFRELNAAYSYDSEAQVLKKFASETVVDEKNELLTFDGKNTKPLIYETVNVPLGNSGDTINITYTVHNGKLIIAEVPEMAITPYEYFIINGSTDKFIAEDNNGSYLVNLNELSAKPFMNLGGLVNSNSEIKLFSISPDGKYMLYFVKHSENRGANINEFYLCVYDIISETGDTLIGFANITDLAKWEFLAWEKNASGSFLYREKYVDIYGLDRYSNIYRYVISSKTSNTFLDIDEKYSQYGIVDDEHIFIHSYKSSHMNGILYVKNIYTQEVKIVVLPRYAIIWDMLLSDSKEYAALYALFVDAYSNQVSRLVTVNLNTNDIRFYYEVGYEPGLENYDMHSFYWCPDNVLVVNFLNTMNLYNDLCRFHKVEHTKSNIPKIDIEDIIYKDSVGYEEEE